MILQEHLDETYKTEGLFACIFAGGLSSTGNSDVERFTFVRGL
jgi:hypothetical protein